MINAMMKTITCFKKCKTQSTEPRLLQIIYPGCAIVKNIILNVC